MRKSLLALIAAFALPFDSYGQSSLDFPRSIQPSELAATGFAIVNPGPTPATVTFTLYRGDGAAERVSSQTVPARGQLAKTGGELFPRVANAGWVQAVSATSGLQGFWVGGDFVTFMDGSEAAASSVELVLPLPLVSPQFELHVANTGVEEVIVLIELYGEDGLQLATPYPRAIRPKGFFTAAAASLFPATNVAPARYIRLRCMNPFAALVVARAALLPGWAVVNALPASTSTMELYFPQVVDGAGGGGNWQSVLGVTNLSATSSNDVSITFTTENGIVLQTARRTLSPKGAIRESARSLFGLPPGYQNGWVRVVGTLPVTGFVSYADSIAGGVAVVPAQSRPRTNLLFAHIADLGQWQTGLALLNTNLRSATVEVFALAPDGSLIGGAANVPSARFSLDPGAKVSRLLSEWIPETRNRSGDGGFVFVRSDAALYGIELFFTRDLQVLSNVPAGGIAAGITYSPPSPR